VHLHDFTDKNVAGGGNSGKYEAGLPHRTVAQALQLGGAHREMVK
jgi:hypothetical protein